MNDEAPKVPDLGTEYCTAERLHQIAGIAPNEYGRLWICNDCRKPTLYVTYRDLVNYFHEFNGYEWFACPECGGQCEPCEREEDEDSRSAGKEAGAELKLCPFCGKAVEIVACDECGEPCEEGVRPDKWGLRHFHDEDTPYCILATHEQQGMERFFESREVAVAEWNRRDGA